jgi:hypothetical protein
VWAPDFVLAFLLLLVLEVLEEREAVGQRRHLQHVVVHRFVGGDLENVENKLFSFSCDFELRGHCMCKEMIVISVKRVVDKKRIIGKNGGPWKSKGSKSWTVFDDAAKAVAYHLF